MNLFRRKADSASTPTGTRVLILTPVKDIEDCIFGYWRMLFRLTYPHKLISLGFLESDSSDRTYELLQSQMKNLNKEFRRANLWKHDFGYHIPEGFDRKADWLQPERRSVLAKSRNHLLSHALQDEDWVLWIDADLLDYPEDIIQTMLATGRDIVQPHCVLEYGGPTYDTNGWRDKGRAHLDDLRGGETLVPLDAVGGTMLLIRADIHREGLVFPTFPYGLDNPRRREGRGEVETEGLGIMAQDMGYQAWGMPYLEFRHRNR
jgi:hypothetical protein